MLALEEVSACRKRKPLAKVREEGKKLEGRRTLLLELCAHQKETERGDGPVLGHAEVVMFICKHNSVTAGTNVTYSERSQARQGSGGLR